MAEAWSLPQGVTVHDAGVRSYRFTVVYETSSPQGAVLRRQRISGDYQRGLAGGEVAWKNVAQADADGASAPFGAAQKREFMEGFRYRNDLGLSMQPAFFKAFPATAVFERNLVWDTGMIELFGQRYFDKLQLNQPLHAMTDQNVEMPGLGSFRNRDVVLEWVGRSQRNGQDCALIDYRAFGNPLQVAVGGMSLKARSDYWGQIWVSLKTRQIEYATLYENVAGELKLPGQDAPQPMIVFRSGVFEPVAEP
ncbi:hypothetical protein DBR42_29110 [Pelomonas sp. HMWF004]|nr:hypothetical protein DBR42_29110 [Pelomonas sp. HMWF004]